MTEVFCVRQRVGRPLREAEISGADGEWTAMEGAEEFQMNTENDSMSSKLAWYVAAFAVSGEDCGAVARRASIRLWAER
jgi:hypothetical protein